MRTYAKKILLASVAALSALLAPPALAQSVSISPRTGGLLMAETESGELGADNGLSAMWLHNQIGLTLQVSDYPTLTEGGGLKVPAGNISLYCKDAQDEGRYVLMGGSEYDHYLALSLPEGFRFTGYELVVKNDLNGKKINGVSLGSTTKTLYETDKTFNINAGKYYIKTAEMASSNSENEVRLSRESSERGADMGNHLYFRIQRGTNNFFGLSIVSFVVRFTTEGGVDVAVAPSHVKNTASTHGLATFAVGKTDVGPLTPYRDKRDGVHYAYNYANYKSLRADNIIYSSSAVGDDKKVDLTDQTGKKTITGVYNDGSMHWGLGNDTYYVETPVEAHSLSGTHHAVTYRITGARVNYKYGQSMAGTTDTIHGPITYTDADGATLYLNSQGFFTTVEDEAHVWKKVTGDDGRIRIRDERNHYMLVHEVKEDAGHIRRSLYVSAVEADSMLYRIENNDTLERYKDVYVACGGAVYYDVQTTETVTGDDGTTTTVTTTTHYYLTGSGGGTSPGFSADTDDAAVALRASFGTTTVGAFTPRPYTLSVYDGQTGLTVAETAQVSEDNPSGTITLTGLNNDAIKFEVSDLPPGGQALVTVDLTIEALNPYFSRLRMVCEDPVDHRQMAQTFTVDEFDVRGGKFVFYVPGDFVRSADTKLNFFFDRLYHRYADNTYGNTSATGKARHSFVGSDYYGTSAANVDNLYDKDPDHTYTDKVGTLYCGSDPFVFNNVNELGIATEEDETKYLEEYRFTLDAYDGEFAQLQKGCESGTDVRFIFTADETRYNIAPTRATQHRAHAAYRLEFELETRDYTPKATWTKVYDQTCYGLDGRDVTRPQWGLTLETTVPEGEAQGYLTTDQIVGILRAMRDSTGDAQANIADILYVDASRLSTIAYQKADDGTISAPGAIRSLLGPNALVYLPRLMTVDDDNFAYLTEQGSFRASNNIIITDGKPFYAPYDIQVGAYRHAAYRRSLRWLDEWQRTNCTLMLPFALSIDQTGLHTDSECSFRLHTMQADNCLGGSAMTDDGVSNYFGSLRAGTLAATAEANTPYMVEVVSHPDDSEADFTVRQPGAVIRASTGMDAADYTFAGETGQGTVDGMPLTFSHHGSYSGRKLDKNGGYFYFASNMLLNSRNLVRNDVYVYPFRSYYECSSAATRSQLPQMRIVYGDNPWHTGATGLAAVGDDGGLLVTTGQGTLTVTASRACDAGVVAVDGTTVARLRLADGESRTLSLAAGVYLVGKTKVIVK